ncbi:hypothetical protein [uncultured Reyranella sp.]|uniref:hypothetical protein n=1 Tax=uncultured Reyranella sp. TaxID=735512 RepID=UPI0025F8952F|nr:hypothetical protein [uncultured Reyranella sp.]
MKKKVVKKRNEAEVVAIMSKWSEPQGILKAWMQISPKVQYENSFVRMTINSVLSGRDPRLDALLGFLKACEAENIPVKVEPKNGKARPFVVEDNGSAYTPKAKESPIRKRPLETDKAFFARWDLHRQAIASSIVHELLEENGTSMDDIRRLAKESYEEVMKQRDLSLWEVWATTLAETVIPKEKLHDLLTGNEPEPVAPPAPMNHVDSVTITRADFDTLMGELRCLHAKVDALTPKPVQRTAEIIPFRPKTGPTFEFPNFHNMRASA